MANVAQVAAGLCSDDATVALQAHLALAGVYFRLPAHDDVGQSRPADPVAGRQRADAAGWRRGALQQQQQQLRQAGPGTRSFPVMHQLLDEGSWATFQVLAPDAISRWSSSCAGALMLQGSRRRGQAGGSSSALWGGSGRRRATSCQPPTCSVSEPSSSRTQSDVDPA